MLIGDLAQKKKCMHKSCNNAAISVDEPKIFKNQILH